MNSTTGDLMYDPLGWFRKFDVPSLSRGSTQLVHPVQPSNEPQPVVSGFVFGLQSRTCRQGTDGG